MKIPKTMDRRRALPAIPALFAAAALLSVPAPVQAGAFSLFKGKLVGITKTTVTFGAAWRNAEARTQMVGAGAGQGENPEFPGASGAVGVNDDANLNFRKNDLVSLPMTLTSEVTLRHSSGQGVFVRLRAWNDILLESQSMSHGSGPTAYVKDVQLDDSGYLGAAKFHGVDIYDAFFFGHYKVGEARFTLRLGRQALDWGESLLYPGMNTFNPYDVAWLTTTGAVVANGGRMPVNRAYVAFSGPAGWSFDAFYNLGLVHYQRNELEVAVANFRSAIEQDPMYFRARFNLGVVYFELGRNDLAEAEWGKVIESAPGSALAEQAQQNLAILRDASQ